MWETRGLQDPSTGSPQTGEKAGWRGSKAGGEVWETQGPDRRVGALHQPAGRSGQRRRLSVGSQEHEGDEPAGTRVGEAGPVQGSATPTEGAPPTTAGTGHGSCREPGAASSCVLHRKTPASAPHLSTPWPGVHQARETHARSEIIPGRLKRQS